MRGLVMTSSKAHFGFNNNIKIRIGWGMKWSSNVAPFVHCNGLKISFPLGIPID